MTKKPAKDENKKDAEGDSSEKDKPRVYAKGEYFLELYKASTPLLATLIWPLALLIIVYAFREPLKLTADLLPSILSRSSRIEVSGVTLEVNRRLELLATDELKQALSDISPDAIKALVDLGTTGRTTYSKYTTEEEMQNLLELESKGLIKLELNYQHATNPELDIHYESTELGKKAYEFLLEIIFDQFSIIFPSNSK